MKLLLTAFVLTLIPSIAVAQDFDDGWAAYKKGDYEAAFEAWIAPAKTGDPQSQTAIGSLIDSYRAHIFRGPRSLSMTSWKSTSSFRGRHLHHAKHRIVPGTLLIHF